MQNILSDLFIQPLFDESSALITFTTPEKCNCSWQIISEKKVICQDTADFDSGKKVKIYQQIKDFIPWHPDNPHLYNFKMTIKVDQQLYELSENFGMRKIEARGKWIYLNNEKIYIRGHIRGREAHDHPNFLGITPTSFYTKNIKQAQKYGFNLTRFHSRIPDEDFLNAADKLGMLVHVELRKYYGKYQKERTMMTDEGELLDKDQWTRTIQKLRNHPSVVVYCMGNEIKSPGRNPFVYEIAALTKELDPTRLFIDTCAHGEYDREYVDFDVQHMSYYYPYGSNYDMFDNTYNWHIYGSCNKDKQLVKKTDSHSIKRTLNIHRPVLAHEICHYIALHDIYKLDEKFKSVNAEKPWWVDETKKLIEKKGMVGDYDKLYKASKYFQKISWKLGIEAVRRSKLLAGYHFLQLADTDVYENSNGIIDCFNDDRDVNKEDFFKAFNSEMVLLADLPQRTFFAKQVCDIPVLISHFNPKLKENAKFVFELVDEQNNIITQNCLENIGMSQLGLYEICQISIALPETFEALTLELRMKLLFDGVAKVENNWSLWVYPNNPEAIEDIDCKIKLDSIDTTKRYQNLTSQDVSNKGKLLVKDRFDDKVFEQLTNGGDVVMLYRVPETRARKQPAEYEQYYLPTSWDRFKGVIWDRGTFCGGLTSKHPITDSFSNNGCLDLQFHDLIDDCDKINLDNFPIQDIKPIVQGIDKPVRDRYDVYTYKLSELQPEWTFRKFAYLFELKVGKGRLLISGFNFTGIEQNKPAVCYMFELILKYANSNKFDPSTVIELSELKDYLRLQGNSPRIPDRKMTQFWQLNDTPLETDEYWLNAEKFIAKQSNYKK